MIEIFVHLGQAFQSAGSFFKDMLFMRLFLVIGIGLEMVYQFNGPEKQEPLWALFFWSSLFILINLYQITILAFERMRSKLNEKERRLYEIVFPGMLKYNFKKLISKAHWKIVPKDTYLVNEGTHLPDLVLIYKGLAEVKHESTILAMLRDGQFVGEMSFLSGHPTTADVLSATDLEYVYWNKQALEELMTKSPEISADLQKIFNNDLIHKLVKKNQEKQVK